MTETKPKMKKPNFRYCLGKCRKTTPHLKQLLTNGDFLITCHNCNREAIAWV